MMLANISVLAVLSWQDWTVIVAFLTVSIIVGLLFTTRAGKNLEEYFVSGRSLPWWLAGTSMVATTLAADTPLAVTEFVRKYGIYHNWWWWSLGLGAILSTVLLARLWRRSGVRTDVELIEIRYSGPSAHVLRGFRACYFGIVWNLTTIGWVTAAMLSISTEALFGHGREAVQLLPYQKMLVIAGLMAVAGVYSIFSGLWGVVVTDLLQFLLAMTGAVALAIFAVNAVGGMDGLMAALPHSPLFKSGQTLRLVPAVSFSEGLLGAFGIFLIYIGLFWWTDKTVDQGGYLAQRLFACKTERHAQGASLWFAIAHYALRPWPWIIAGLVTMVMFAGETDHKATYTMLIMRVMGPWWRGLLVASLLAAFISTVNTQINWGASYLMTDLYQRYMVRKASIKHYVWVGRLISLALLLAAGVASYFITSIEQAWKFLALLGAGSGVVLLGRWLWWRVNAWSELAALGAALGCSIALALGVSPKLHFVSGGNFFARFAGFSISLDGPPLNFAQKLVWVVPIVTICWLVATFITQPTSRSKLAEFVRRIRPPGPGWGPVHREAGTQPPPGVLGRTAVAWLGGVSLVFGMLFAIGKLLLAGVWAGVPFLVLAAAGGVCFFVAVPRGEADQPEEQGGDVG